MVRREMIFDQLFCNKFYDNFFFILTLCSYIFLSIVLVVPQIVLKNNCSNNIHCVKIVERTFNKERHKPTWVSL